MIEAYKYMHGFYTTGSNLLQLDRDKQTETRGHPFKLKKQYCGTSTRQNFFSFRIVQSWNSLPTPVVTAPSLNSFKARLDRVWSKHTYTKNIHFPLPPAKIKDVDLVSDEEHDQLTGK